MTLDKAILLVDKWYRYSLYLYLADLLSSIAGLFSLPAAFIWTLVVINIGSLSGWLYLINKKNKRDAYVD